MGDAKVFVGGLSRAATEDSLREYFSNWGVVKDVSLPRTPEHESRGFAFITYNDPEAAQKAVAYQQGCHVIHGKQTEVKICADRKNQQGEAGSGGDLDPTKIFVGGLPFGATKEVLISIFSQYGQVVHAVIMMDNETGRSKGFGFVTFADRPTTDYVVGLHYVDVLGKKVEVKRAIMTNRSPSGSGSGSDSSRFRPGFRQSFTRPQYGQYGAGGRSNQGSDTQAQYGYQASQLWNNYQQAYAQYGYSDQYYLPGAEGAASNPYANYAQYMYGGAQGASTGQQGYPQQQQQQQQYGGYGNSGSAGGDSSGAAGQNAALSDLPPGVSSYPSHVYAGGDFGGNRNGMENTPNGK